MGYRNYPRGPGDTGHFVIARSNETMDKKRFDEVSSPEWGDVLTEKELAEGWHFCPDWDYLLVGPGMPEQDGCACELYKNPSAR